jgi:hypothetical protein
MFGTGSRATGLARIINQMVEGATFGALMILILWVPHFL